MAWGTPWTQQQGPPRIDLLPRKLVEERLARRQRTGTDAGFLVLLAALGVWYVLETQQLSDAQAAADQERATATNLRAQRAQLQPLADLDGRRLQQHRERVRARDGHHGAGRRRGRRDHAGQ